MNAANQNRNGYSADVRMRLSVNGHVFVIGQLGPDFVILDDPVDYPPGEGEIILSVDGRVRRWPVGLPDGVAVGRLDTRIVDCPSGNGAKAE
jgi:hypothetical protein